MFVPDAVDIAMKITDKVPIFMALNTQNGLKTRKKLSKSIRYLRQNDSLRGATFLLYDQEWHF